MHLFYPEMQDMAVYGGHFLESEASKKQVAANIRAYVKRAKAGKIKDDER
jgi:hypothetical protein